jgi:hypothetical protein
MLCLRCSFSSVGLSVVLVVRWGRHTLCQALVFALAGAAWQCVWLLAFGILLYLLAFKIKEKV